MARQCPPDWCFRANLQGGPFSIAASFSSCPSGTACNGGHEEIVNALLEKDNIEVVASLSEILSHRGENIEAMELIDSALEQDPTSLLVKLIKMKHQAKKERSGNEYLRGLDDLIHFLVTDERFKIYKNTDTDPDILWLYETSADKEIIES